MVKGGAHQDRRVASDQELSSSCLKLRSSVLRRTFLVNLVNIPTHARSKQTLTLSPCDGCKDARDSTKVRLA